MKEIAGVILDWAGTAVDFGCFAPVHVFCKVFRDAGIEVTDSEARAPMGLLKRDHIKAMLNMPRITALWKEKHGRMSTEEDVDALYAAFEPALLSSLHEYTEPLPEVLTAVAELRRRGLKIGSTTGYTDAMMRIVADGAKAKGYAPDFWITPDSTGSYGRPYPYMIFRNMEKLRLPAPWTAVKVGDTEADIREAVRAGVWAVGVAVGSSQMGLSQQEFISLPEEEKRRVIMDTDQAFYSYGADFTITSMAELPALIEHIDILLKQDIRPNGK